MRSQTRQKYSSTAVEEMVILCRNEIEQNRISLKLNSRLGRFGGAVRSGERRGAAKDKAI